jgi:hypothetical protein
MADSRDWDKQMAEIDRLMAKSGPPATPAPTGAPANVPAAPAPAPAAPRREAPAPATPRGPTAMTRGGLLGLWALALMGPLGAASLAIWPYAKGCGTMLAVYLVGVAAVAGAGIWTMRASWVARRGLPHLLGLATLLAALALAALEILPRVGYAATALTWGCTI